MHDHNHNHEHHSHDSELKVSHTFRDFLPLVVIFVAIIVVTWYLASKGPSEDIFSVLRNFMAVFFLVFGAFKLLNLKGFADAYQVYDVVAKRSRFYAYLYPFIELGLGFAYLFSFNLLVTNWVTLVVMLVSAYGVYLKLREREVIPCACLGVVFKIPMTWVTLFEDLLMATMAAVMFFLI